MPLDGRMPLQFLAAFAVVGLLSVTLRWIFGRRRDALDALWPPDPEDFGLLAPAAVVDTADEAHRIKILLTDAEIKATSSLGADGRYRVLVFSSELDRARRVTGGWSP